ncbi:MAG: GNAT family N-acetyltransferase [Chloroflexi bacterium]|nr:MAG: GNAT family N-acetyltransferase [Chloroflexota bacterium]
MKTTHRDYSEEVGDFRRLANFILENNEQIRDYSTWCIGRFVDWKYGMYEHKTAVPDFTNRNAHLWFDGFGNLAGFVISEEGDSGFAILTQAGYRFLFAEMLQWVMANWGDRGPTMSIEVTELQSMEIKALEQAGFQRKFEFYTQTFDLTQPPAKQFSLEEGFTIVDMAAHPDYRAQRILRDDAFGGRSDVPEDVLQRELLFYNHMHQGPIYHPETDLCVMADDGRFVAGCEALIDARNVEADIERVCTLSGFRRRGFARVVIQECLNRLREMGMRKAYITGYSEAAIALYGSMGASEAATLFGYETAV